MAKKKAKEEESNEGMSLDDAFADDEDVEYAKPKPRKKTESKTANVSVLDEEVAVSIKGSKPIGEIKKGDKVKVDGLVLEVDAQIVLIDHGSTKEMAIECFDPKNDKDYQIRYFSDQVGTSIEVYSLEEIVYSRMRFKKIEW